jgi:hypothetical protein
VVLLFQPTCLDPGLSTWLDRCRSAEGFQGLSPSNVGSGRSGQPRTILDPPLEGAPQKRKVVTPWATGLPMTHPRFPAGRRESYIGVKVTGVMLLPPPSLVWLTSP